MKPMKQFAVAFLLSSALCITGCAAQTAETTETEASTDATLSSEAPFVNMKTTDLNGKTIDSSIFSENKLTFVNVWNIGCTPCVNEIPELDKLNTEYADKGVAVLGLYDDFAMGISDDEMKEIKNILNDADASYTQLRMDGTLAVNENLLNIYVFPTTYVVDSEGNIIDTIEGSNDFEGWASVTDTYLAALDN